MQRNHKTIGQVGCRQPLPHLGTALVQMRCNAMPQVHVNAHGDRVSHWINARSRVDLTDCLGPAVSPW